MRRKRLKHCAYIFCHMFRGWRLHNDWEAIVQLGAGHLKIDVLTETCWHNDNEIPTLTIARELRRWLLEDLEAHHTPLNGIREASLTVELEIGTPKPTPSGPDVLANFHCQSQISTDEKVYTSTYADKQRLSVSVDALNLEKQEKEALVQECLRMARVRPKRRWRWTWPFRRR